MTTHERNEMGPVTLKPEVQARLVALAKSTNRSVDELVSDAVDKMLAFDDEFRAKVERGLADIRAGRVVDDDKVDAWLQSWGTEDEQDPPE